MRKIILVILGIVSCVAVRDVIGQSCPHTKCFHAQCVYISTGTSFRIHEEMCNNGVGKPAFEGPSTQNHADKTSNDTTSVRWWRKPTGWGGCTPSCAATGSAPRECTEADIPDDDHDGTWSCGECPIET